MKPSLDAFDYKIMATLQDHGRITNVQLAESIGLSSAATLERVKQLETQGIISSYHARIDSLALGLTTNLWLQVCLYHTTLESMQAFQEGIEQIPEVVACYHVVGIADFLVHVFTSDTKAYQNLLITKIGSLTGIRSLTTFSVLDTIKEAGLPFNHLPFNLLAPQQG
jgi:Lrp/AsnC family leucine-responsive transcriptional regulator